MRRFPGLNLVLQAVLAAWTLSAAHAGVALKPVLGSQSAEIGTFHGWVGWVGWDATFSESYNPVQETYGWVVYFGPFMSPYNRPRRFIRASMSTWALIFSMVF